MQNKDLIIIALIVVILYLVYQQSQEFTQSPLIVESPLTQQLRAELNHYQTLYQKRVEKDLAGKTAYVEFQEMEQQNQEFLTFLKEEIGSENVEDLRTKLAGKKLTEILKENDLKETEIKELKQTNHQNQVEYQALEKKFQQGQIQKQELAKYKNLAELQAEHQAQLRKINLLFDPNSVNYEMIDFQGLYALLSSIAEREREREQK